SAFGGSASINTLQMQGSGITLNTGLFRTTNLLSSGVGNVINASGTGFLLNSENFFWVDGDLTINGTVPNYGSAVRGFTKSGPGNLTLTGTNTFSANGANHGTTVKINGGTLSFSSSANLGASTAEIDIYTGTLRLLGGQGLQVVTQTVDLDPAN